MKLELMRINWLKTIRQGIVCGSQGGGENRISRLENSEVSIECLLMCKRWPDTNSHVVSKDLSIYKYTA